MEAAGLIPYIRHTYFTAQFPTIMNEKYIPIYFMHLIPTNEKEQRKISVAKVSERQQQAQNMSMRSVQEYVFQIIWQEPFSAAGYISHALQHDPTTM